MEPMMACEQCGNTPARSQHYLLDGKQVTLCEDCILLERLGGPDIVCLCGSTRFGEEFKRVMLEETLKGNIVLTVGTHERIQAIHDDVKLKQMLDRLHMWKIRKADRVIVINPGGYIGESTAREIKMATRLGKPISYTGDFKDTEHIELKETKIISGITQVELDVITAIRHDCLKEAVFLHKDRDEAGASVTSLVLGSARRFSKFVETGEA